jgi:hypothetical protein
MKTRTSAAIALGLSLAAGAASAHGVRYTTARVTAVEPVYETVVVDRPYRRCASSVAAAGATP